MKPTKAPAPLVWNVCAHLASTVTHHSTLLLPCAVQSSVQLIKKGSFNRQRNSGLACVVLSKSSDVDNSCKTLDGKNVMGRPMIVRKNKFEDDQPSYHVPAAAAAMQPAAV